MKNFDRSKSLADVLSAPSAIKSGQRNNQYYSKDGDCWFIVIEDVPYKRVRVDEFFTAYEALDDRRLVGIQIKSIENLKRDSLSLECIVDEHEGYFVVALLMEAWKVDAIGVEPEARWRMYMRAIKLIPEDTKIFRNELATS